MHHVISSEKKPIKIWADTLDDNALDQAKNLANLPFIHSHVALMADSHLGYGMPIGGVIATKDVVIPNAVGVDCGCGMIFTKTNIPVSSVRDVVQEHNTTLLHLMTDKVKRIIPLGFSKHKMPQEWSGFQTAPDTRLIQDNLENAALSLGTLGGGNHFIEFQSSEDGMLCLMIHSGSRNLGKQICDYYNKKAKELNKKWNSSVDPSHDLAFLPIGETATEEYLDAMTFALRFASMNRTLMMERLKSLVFNLVEKYHGDMVFETTMSHNVHHNYAALEKHYGQNVWVHRKGATSARAGEYGIIPGSQGTKSYIVIGKGNRESFTSCSHGAGRLMGRNKAREFLNLDSERQKLDDLGVIHSLGSKNDLDEAPGAYKDIAKVMANQADLVSIEMVLTPLAVVKGPGKQKRKKK